MRAACASIFHRNHVSIQLCVKVRPSNSLVLWFMTEHVNLFGRGFHAWKFYKIKQFFLIGTCQFDRMIGEFLKILRFSSPKQRPQTTINPLNSFNYTKVEARLSKLQWNEFGFWANSKRAVAHSKQFTPLYSTPLPRSPAGA